MKRTIVIECKSCGGTGLKKSLLEQGKSAVICTSCNGTGKINFTYKKFKGRKEMRGITRVFAKDLGYIHSDTDISTKNGEILHFSQYGCTYEEWKKGVKPTPMEELYCPYIYSENHGIGNEPCSRCNIGNKEYGNIKKCKFYSDKSNCWKEWHKNND